MIHRENTTHGTLIEDIEPEVSLSHIVRVLWGYRGAIVVSLAVVFGLYLIGAIGYVFWSPSAEVVTMPFNLDFRGSETGQYPNGTPFRASDIVARPSLRQVYVANSLQRYVGFDEFSAAVFIIESNQKLEELRREYEAKLADPKLNPVDRRRLEEEFALKRDSLSKSSYSINFVSNEATSAIPVALVKKSLEDVLANWADHVATERGALRYRVPVVTRNIVRRDQILAADPIIAIDMIRAKISEVDRNVGDMLAVPGAEVLRGGPENISLTEIRLDLRDTVRLEVDPLLVSVISEGLSQSREEALQFLQTQLDYNRIQLQDAEARIATLKEAIEIYRSEEGRAAPPSVPGLAGQTSASETIMPQIDQSFLDRLIEMSGLREDREYRQALVDEIKNASLRAVPYQIEIVRYEKLIKELQSPRPRSRAEELEDVRARLGAIVDDVTKAIDEINAIYAILSENLNPPSALYKTSEPARVETLRAVPISRLGLAGILVLLVAFPIIVFSVLIHNRIGEEKALEEEFARQEAEAKTSAS